MIKRGVTVAILLLVTFSGVSRPSAMERKRVLMALWRGPTTVEWHFKEYLGELGVSVTYTEVNGGQDRTRLGEALRAVGPDMMAGKFDVIYSYGTTVSIMVTQFNRGRIPVVFNRVFDPVGAGLVNSLERPGRNITGVSNGVPIDLQLDTFRKLKPFRRMVLLFTSREKNATLLSERVDAWASARGVALSLVRVAPNSDALDRAIEGIRSGKIPCDMVYGGADSYLASRAVEINNAIGRSVPLFGGTGTFVEKGWLGAYAPPLDEMGRAAALKVKEVLEGARAGEVPVTLPRPVVILSAGAARRFGIVPPEDAILQP